MAKRRCIDSREVAEDDRRTAPQRPSGDASRRPWPSAVAHRGAARAVARRGCGCAADGSDKPAERRCAAKPCRVKRVRKAAAPPAGEAKGE